MQKYGHIGEKGMEKERVQRMRYISGLVCMPAFHEFDVGALESMAGKQKFRYVEFKKAFNNVRPLLGLFVVALIPYPSSPSFALKGTLPVLSRLSIPIGLI